MDKPIIIINGTAGCGKDMFVKYATKFGKVLNFSSVEMVKELARLAGWNGEKTEKDRKFLSDLKRLTTEYNDMSFEKIKEAVEVFKNSDNDIMFIHIREPEEIEKVVKAFSAKTLLIRRENVELIKSNYSDANVENYDYDYIIENTSLEEFEEKAKEFMNKICLKN